MTSVPIAFVDNEPVTSAGLAQVFARRPEYSVMATGSTSKDMLTIAAQVKPALMFVDPAAPTNALAAISVVTAKHPNTKIIAYTAATDTDHVMVTFQAGAQGYVSKSSSGDELLTAAKAVMGGATYVSQNLASGVIAALRVASARDNARRALKLSVREDQIIKLVMQGLRNQGIGERLGISEKTVKRYMTGLMEKLGARNRVEALIAAQKL